ncbi:hypothetical protein Enr10x_31940 [Gimesia panareensis]|uniref:Uncharacterized protein n=1 Tax=Gimesia panareensis TaxID=2527978 RepID=A0A517Q8A8_9PLAN|nr:hypothetical protein [Gimesia panareensis]QDT27859.1 hypothetical protein Enr10x_31940 [Gimesia panareensis]
MGTSTGYDAPPAWGAQKRQITQRGNIALTPTKAKSYLSNHISNNGGASRISYGGGVLGGGGDRSAQSTIGGFAGFVGQVAHDGLDEALRRNNLSDLVGGSPADIVLGLVGLFGHADNSHDAVDARSALSRLMDELLANAETSEEVESVFGDIANVETLTKLTMKFFAYHLYEQFCRVHFEHLVQQHGDAVAVSFLGDIMGCIKSLVLNRSLDIDVYEVDWMTEWGNFSNEIMRMTLEVFS